MKQFKMNLAIICLSLSFSACYSSKFNIDDDSLPVEKNTNTCQVYFKDGSNQTFQSLKLVTGVLKTPYLIADEKLKLESNKISSYTDGNIYAISQEKFYVKEKGHVATKVLPGFAIKEITGNINLYSLQLYKNGNVCKKYFLQFGETGAITPYSPAVLNEFLQLNGTIDASLRKTITKAKAKKLVAIIENYNTNKALTVN